MVPRQFMDMGPAATAETDEASQSSSEGRSREPSESPQNNVEVVSKEFNLANSKGDIVPFDQERLNAGEGSPDQASQGWIPNKAPKLPISKNDNAEQSAAEATMRKARVSVRARSEAPMVTINLYRILYPLEIIHNNNNYYYYYPFVYLVLKS